MPYTLGIELNIISKTQDEALQILEQILPTFTPEYTVAIKDMYGPNNSYDVPIVLNSVNMQHEYEGDFETRQSIVYTLGFTMRIRFYGMVDPKPVIREVTADLFNTSTPESAIDPIDRVNTGLGTENDAIDDYTTTTTFGFDDDSP